MLVWVTSKKLLFIFTKLYQSVAYNRSTMKRCFNVYLFSKIFFLIRQDCYETQK